MSFLEKIRIRMPKPTPAYLIIACIGQILVWSVHPQRVEIWKVVVLLGALVLTVLSMHHILTDTQNKDHVSLFLKVWGLSVALAIVEIVICRLLGGLVSLLAGLVLLFLIVDPRPLPAAAAA